MPGPPVDSTPPEVAGPKSSPEWDLCIAGTGPAGLALAAACSDRGIAVAVIGPAPTQPWPNNYGMWLDDAERLGLADRLAARWSATEVVLAGTTVGLGRGYARIDNAALQSSWLARCPTVLDDSVSAVDHRADSTILTLASKRTVSARLFVDATGHDSKFVERDPAPAPGYQVAWGELRSGCPRELSPAPDTMRFMDWTPSGGSPDGLPPSFLYCMPMADGVFVEETVLVGRPTDPSEWFEPLRARLHARLPSLSATPLIHTERCVIPMGGPPPRSGQRTLAFGGAAGFVHPATGYMLTVALQRVDRVATAIHESIDLPIADACAQVERAIWTETERRAWELYRFGMEVMIELDHPGIEQFFTEFFELPAERWRSFLSATAATPSLMATMLRYFAVAPAPIRRRLAAHLFGRDGIRLARSLF